MDAQLQFGDIETKLAPNSYEFYDSKIDSPILIACPHSGRHYPQELINESGLSLNNLRESEDAFTDLLCSELPTKGGHLICANYARSYIDLNRSPDVLDNSIIDNAPYTNCTMTNSGFGVIPRLVGVGREIYKEKMSLERALSRVKAIHEPYHNKVNSKIEGLKNQFGLAFLFDIHSMPSAALGSLNADIILGDRFGTSCSSKVIELVEALFKDNGLTVRRNHPFAGGYTTIKYGKPKLGVEALQVEINRALYMNEMTFEQTSGFLRIQNLLGEIVIEVLKRINLD